MTGKFVTFVMALRLIQSKTIEQRKKYFCVLVTKILTQNKTDKLGYKDCNCRSTIIIMT